MNRWEKWTLHLATAVVALSGVAYFVMEHALTPDDPFSVVNHPLQPLMLKIHILSAPALVLIMGVVFRSHIAGKVSKRFIPNRKTGIAALALFLPMVISGYLLQVVTDPALLQATLVAHLVSSGLFVGLFVAHQAIALWLARRSSRRAAQVAPASFRASS